MTTQSDHLGETPANVLSRGHIRSSSTSLISEAISTGYNDDELSKVQIYGDLTQYEEKVAALVDSVDHFKPDIKIVHDLIDVDKRLYKSLDTFAEYDTIDAELKRLDRESAQLEERTKEVLEILNECYSMLNALTMLEQVEFEKQTILKQRSKINSSELLNYATKLSKFTKIPPTFDKGTIGPNNFVWPAEDALRRGMLAIASLHSKEMTKIPGEPDEEEEEDKDKEKHTDQLKDENDAKNKGVLASEPQEVRRRSSYVMSGNPADNIIEDNKDADDEALDLDLDLFNPDEF